MDNKILSKEPISITDVDTFASSLGKTEDLLDGQNRMRLHAKKFKRLSKTDAEKLKIALKSLEIIRLGEEHIAQIISFVPKDIAELRSIFIATKTNVKPEELQKILDVVKGFAK